jgi:hypothetical protein
MGDIEALNRLVRTDLGLYHLFEELLAPAPKVPFLSLREVAILE